MDANDLKALSRLGRSVWVNSEDWERSTLEVVTAVSLLDPFAWARFIESVKRGDLKRKDRKDKED